MIKELSNRINKILDELFKQTQELSIQKQNNNRNLDKNLDENLFTPKEKEKGYNIMNVRSDCFVIKENKYLIPIGKKDKKNKNKQIDVFEIPIEPDKRYIYSFFGSHGNKYDIDIDDFYDYYESLNRPTHIQKINDKYYYSPRIEQDIIDEELLIEKIKNTDSPEIYDLLDYQLTLYDDKQKRLNLLSALVENKGFFQYIKKLEGTGTGHAGQTYYKKIEQDFENKRVIFKQWIETKLEVVKEEKLNHFNSFVDSEYERLVNQFDKNYKKVSDYKILKDEIYSVEQLLFRKDSQPKEIYPRNLDLWGIKVSIALGINADYHNWRKNNIPESYYDFITSYYDITKDNTAHKCKILALTFEKYLKYLIVKKNEIKSNKYSEPPQESKQIETNQPKPDIKPKFKPEEIPTIFDILKNYFPDQNTELKQVLETGINNKVKLLFNGSGITFLDFLKQLMKGQFLTVVVQKDLETWVSNGFAYFHRGKHTNFTTKYASKIISGNERAAKGNRLIDIKKVSGKFEIEQLEIRNREQNEK